MSPELDYPEKLPCVDIAWWTFNNGLIRTMVKTLYESKEWSHLPILGDALEEAGCSDPSIRAHLDTPHKKSGCWCNECWLVNHLLCEEQPTIGRFADNSHEYRVINPGYADYMWIVYQKRPSKKPRYYVEAPYHYEAIEIFVESKYHRSVEAKKENDFDNNAFGLHLFAGDSINGTMINRSGLYDLRLNFLSQDVRSDRYMLSITENGVLYDHNNIRIIECDRVIYYAPGLSLKGVFSEEYAKYFGP